MNDHLSLQIVAIVNNARPKGNMYLLKFLSIYHSGKPPEVEQRNHEVFISLVVEFFCVYIHPRGCMTVLGFLTNSVTRFLCFLYPCL